MDCNKFRNNITIFATKKGIVVIDSPVKLKLLEILKNGAVSFDELVEISKKAKSTISVHLNDLKKYGLIKEIPNLKDKRKKCFVLSSCYMVSSESPIKENYKQYLDNIVLSSSNGNSSFKENLFMSIRYGMEAYGINPAPIMKRFGYDIGYRIGDIIESDNYNNVLKDISLFWKDKKLGDMNISNPSEVVITNCYHCGKMPNVGKTLCSMDEGIIEGILTKRLKSKFNVIETECNGNGYNHCKFLIK